MIFVPFIFFVILKHLLIQRNFLYKDLRFGLMRKIKSQQMNKKLTKIPIIPE